MMLVEPQDAWKCKKRQTNGTCQKSLCVMTSSSHVSVCFQPVCWPLTPEWGRGRSRVRRKPERSSPGRNAEAETHTERLVVLMLNFRVNVPSENKQLSVQTSSRAAMFHVWSSCSEPLQPPDGAASQRINESWIIFISVWINKSCFSHKNTTYCFFFRVFCPFALWL